MKYAGNIMLSLIVCCIETACTTVATATKQGQGFAEQLETEKNVVSTITKYDEYKNMCNGYKKFHQNEESPLMKTVGITIALAPIVIPFLTVNYIKTDNFFPYHSARQRCLYKDAFAEKGVDFACLDSWRRGKDYYDSDKCILQRRYLHESEVDYFDYRRFLPDKSPINTDKAFLTLVNYYNLMMDVCQNRKELTVGERQACKETTVAMTIQTATSGGVKCSEMYKLDGASSSNNYTQELEFWALQYQLFTRRDGYTSSEAREIIANWAKDYGKNNLCDISGWEKDMNDIIRGQSCKHSNK